MATTSFPTDFIHWITAYPVDNAIQPLNNWALVPLYEDWITLHRINHYPVTKPNTLYSGLRFICAKLFKTWITYPLDKSLSSTANVIPFDAFGEISAQAND